MSQRSELKRLISVISTALSQYFGLTAKLLRISRPSQVRKHMPIHMRGIHVRSFFFATGAGMSAVGAIESGAKLRTGHGWETGSR